MESIKKSFTISRKMITKYLNILKKEYSYLIKPLYIFIFIYALAIYPIIRANFNYIDDIGRVYYGYSNWNDFSRFISHYFSSFIHASKYLTDISPLPQLIAVLFLSISSVIILHLFKNDKKVSFWNLVSIIPLGLTPYFLACISYKYDSPYMALSILSSIFPLIFFNKDSKYNIPYCIAVFIGVNTMCMTYQAASGIFPLMILFLSFKYWTSNDTKSCIRLIITSFLSYLLGILFFKLFIMVPVDKYASSELLNISNLIPGIINNLRSYYNYVLSDFRRIELVLIVLLCISFIIVQTIYSKQNKILTFIFSSCVIIIGLLISFGLYIILEKPIYSARAMYGFGVLIALISVNCTNLANTYLPRLISICFCWCLFTFAFTYGNVLADEKRFIDFRIQNVINGISEMEIMNNDVSKTIKLVGYSEHTPVIDNMPENYKAKLNRIVPIYFGGNWMWGINTMSDYYRIPNVEFASYDSLVPDDLTLYKDTIYYKIESNDYDYILITIK